jgi:hypothetical protein
MPQKMLLRLREIEERARRPFVTVKAQDLELRIVIKKWPWFRLHVMSNEATLGAMIVTYKQGMHFTTYFSGFSVLNEFV